MYSGQDIFSIFGCSSDFGGQPESCQGADQGGNVLASADGDTSEFFQWDFRGYEWVLWTFFFRWERMLFVRLLWTISRLVVMTGALFEDCCQRHLERSGIRGKKMLWQAKRFVLG